MDRQGKVVVTNGVGCDHAGFPPLLTHSLPCYSGCGEGDLLKSIDGFYTGSYSVEAF